MACSSGSGSYDTRTERREAERASSSSAPAFSDKKISKEDQGLFAGLSAGTVISEPSVVVTTHSPMHVYHNTRRRRPLPGPRPSEAQDGVGRQASHRRLHRFSGIGVMSLS